MKIGKLQLKTVAPDAERLLATTGLSPAEMHGALGNFCQAGTIAAAINACLAEPMDRLELARAIQKAGADAVRVKVRDLFEPESRNA